MAVGGLAVDGWIGRISKRTHRLTKLAEHFAVAINVAVVTTWASWATLDAVGTTAWFVLGVVLLILELFHTAFILCWFAIGAFVVAGAQLLGPIGMGPQVVLFAGTSTSLVVASRTIFSRFLMRRSPGASVQTNVDALPGQTGTVVAQLDNARDQGRVRLQGIEWEARTVDGKPVAEGAPVRVVRVEGVKLFVEVL